MPNQLSRKSIIYPPSNLKKVVWCSVLLLVFFGITVSVDVQALNFLNLIEWNELFYGFWYILTCRHFPNSYMNSYRVLLVLVKLNSSRKKRIAREGPKRLGPFNTSLFSIHPRHFHYSLDKHGFISGWYYYLHCLVLQPDHCSKSLLHLHYFKGS